MKPIDIDDFKRDLPGLLEVDDHQSVIDGFNQIHEAYHALIQMVKPAMGPTYQFQLEKAEKKIGMLQRSNQELITINGLLSRSLESKQFYENYPKLLNPEDLKLNEIKQCKNCKFLHEQTCSKYKKTNLAALVDWKGCGLWEFVIGQKS